MGALGRFLRRCDGGFLHWCPACDEAHFIAVDRPLANGARWTFDGNVIAPTFMPSVLIRVPGDDLERVLPERCHYFIKAGRIEFCGDCTHALRGQTVPLPDFPAVDG